MEYENRQAMHARPSSQFAETAHDNRARGQTWSGGKSEGSASVRPYQLSNGSTRLIAGAVPDTASIFGAVGTAALYALLAAAILLTQEHATLAIGLWPPNACAVAFLLHARLRNEWLVLAAIIIASIGVLLANGFTPGTAAILSFANVAEIGVAVALTRHLCGPVPNLTRLPHLGGFLWAGGLLAPLLSTVLASPALGTDFAAIRIGAFTWLLTRSMAMILLVPAALIVLDPERKPSPFPFVSSGERLAILLAGGFCAFVIFRQAALPLLFLIQPITLLHACRLGSRGTAIHVLAVAAIAGTMTLLGYGPIAAATSSSVTQLLLLQLFVSANLLTGLPVAAILASRNKMIMQLTDGKRRLDMLANNIGDAVLHYDLQGICTYASPSVDDVLGASTDSFIGCPVRARLLPEAQDAMCMVLDRLYSGATERERLTYRRFTDGKNGEPVYLEADCRVAREPDAGTISGVVVAVRDVTKRVELEEQLTHAREEAEQVAQMKSDFLANMSHEIRTPMNGVLGFAEMILQGELQSEQRRYAELIVQSGRSMMMMLNDILDLSKIEAGQFTIDEGPVDLYVTLAECAALHRADATRKGVELVFDCDCGDSEGRQPVESLRHWISTDGLRLRQIVLNLLGNAVKFTKKGTISLTYQLEKDAIRITVRDTGIGIPPSRLESIFTPFDQCGGETARQFGGTGLGLSISLKLADLLDGSITVESELGVGSCFTLTLPAKLIPREARPQPYPVAEEPINLPPAARILLAEDHDVNRLLMCEMLERCGQSVAIAYDGTEAISMVIDSMMRARPYDLLLMDVQMPGCDGYAAARAIRGEGICPEVLPIVAPPPMLFPMILPPPVPPACRPTWPSR
jgi:two-component system, sensor histidine kinase